MSYIGNPIISTDFPKDTFSGNGSTTAFTMSIAPASVNAVIVVVSGITQDPSTYTISGTTLTFSAAPPTGTSNISVRHLGVAGIPNTPSAGSVGLTSLSATGTKDSTTFLRGDNTFAVPPAGAILQVVSTNVTSITPSTTSQSFQDISGFSVSITPSSASNKILVLASFNVGTTSTGGGNNYLRLVRGSTAIDIGDANGSNARATWYARTSDQYTMYPGSVNFLDSPSTTSSTTYKLQWYRNDGTLYLNRPGTFAGGSESEAATTASTITVMEIAG